jgi:hypothetical protein
MISVNHLNKTSEWGIARCGEVAPVVRTHVVVRCTPTWGTRKVQWSINISGSRENSRKFRGAVSVRFHESLRLFLATTAYIGKPPRMISVPTMELRTLLANE